MPRGPDELCACYFFSVLIFVFRPTNPLVIFMRTGILTWGDACECKGANTQLLCSVPVICRHCCIYSGKVVITACPGFIIFTRARWTVRSAKSPQLLWAKWNVLFVQHGDGQELKVLMELWWCGHQWSCLHVWLWISSNTHTYTAHVGKLIISSFTSSHVLLI